LKNYYFVLGLNINAEAHEIKRAFRMLALQYHPDKNPAKQAESIFKEINEAYEVLGDPVQKFQYDRLLKGEPSINQKPHRDPRYKPRPAGSVSRPSKKEEMLATMQAYMNYALVTSRLTLLFSVILMADISLPAKKNKIEVVRLETKREVRGEQTIELEFNDGATVNLSAQKALEFKRGSLLTMQKSALLSIPLSMENELTHFKTRVLATIYGNFIFLPLILLITSLLGTFYSKGIEFRFNLGVVNFFLFFLNLVFLRIHTF